MGADTIEKEETKAPMNCARTDTWRSGGDGSGGS